MVTPFLSKSGKLYVKSIKNHFYGNTGIRGPKFTKPGRKQI
ncbi:hypothetical protein FHS68_000935 [Dyadobacter arcticus]|uniref:Uncharacterized protein n=1 Tax=Dyadobacter arcticus TaxID=1078754 RepID=A0ABX0UI96_9BACT|nr:hypothetical protein [Dyadobacter arcticus]